MKKYTIRLAMVTGASILAVTTASVVNAQEHRGVNENLTVIFATTSAETQNVLDADGNLICDAEGFNCAQELSDLGETRAELLAMWLEEQKILNRVTDIISSDKQSTRQTLAPSAARITTAGYDLQTVDSLDSVIDGVRQVPAELANTEGNEATDNSGSIDPTIQALSALNPGSVALVAVHSDTLYKIIGGADTDGDAATGADASVGFGVNTTVGDNQAALTLFPKEATTGSVPTTGDIWKLVVNNNTGEVRVEWRVNLQPELRVENVTQTNRRGEQRSRAR